MVIFAARYKKYRGYSGGLIQKGAEKWQKKTCTWKVATAVWSMH